MFCLEVLLQIQFSLVKTAELIDLVLVLAADFDLIAHRIFLFLGELGRRSEKAAASLDPKATYHSSLHLELGLQAWDSI